MDYYSSFAVLIQILATLPVTTATNKRSFSALKYLKTYLQNTTKEVHLNGLALLCAHCDISLDFKQVNAEFLRRKFSGNIILVLCTVVDDAGFSQYVLCSIFAFILTSKRKKISKSPSIAVCYMFCLGQDKLYFDI